VVPGDERVSRWVATKIEGQPIEWGPHTCLAVLDEKRSRVVCGVVYSDYREPFDIRASIATEGPGWASKGVLRALFHYPFMQLGVKRITCLIAADNEKSQKLCEKMGFSLEGIHPVGWDGEKDAVSYGLKRENCKWI